MHDIPFIRIKVTYRMYPFNKIFTVPDLVQNTFSQNGHYSHAYSHIGNISKLNTELGIG